MPSNIVTKQTKPYMIRSNYINYNHSELIHFFAFSAYIHQGGSNIALFGNLKMASALCVKDSEKKIMSKFQSSRPISSPAPSQINVVILFFKKPICTPMPDFLFGNISTIGLVS